jgi:hypothetical protein
MPQTYAYPQPVATVGKGFSIAGFVFGIIALLFFPIPFGPLGLIMVPSARTRNECPWPPLP